MALQFILGGTGSGKSYQLYRQIVQQSIAEPDRRFLVIVPEQFTMQTQRDLVMAHKRKGISNIDVLSFMRLSYRVFEEIGLPERLVLEDTGKNMVLRKLLAGLEKELSYFKNTSRKQGFIEELKSLLTELYQYSVSPEQIANLLPSLSEKPLLQQKLSDTLLIYQAFQAYKQRDGYVVAEEMLDLLCDVLPKSDWMKDSVICLDGFTGFTPSQNKVLRLLLTLAKDVVVTVSIPDSESWEEGEEYQLFHLSKKTIHKLEQMAKEEKVEIAAPFYTGYRHGHPQIQHLEQQIFRYPVVPYQGNESNAISLHACRNPKEEAEFVLTEINRLVREEGYRYRDIAVITGDMATYGELLDEVLSREGIYRFIDRKRDIRMNPLVEFLRASLAVIEQGFDYESVMRYLRSGLSGIRTEQADRFENYILARGIRGKHAYRESWLSAQSEADGDGRLQADEATRVAEEVRFAIWTAFEPFVTLCEKEEQLTGRSITVVLYDFLCHHQAEEQIEALRSSFFESGNLLAEKEYAQVYRLVMGLFDKFVSLLGDEILTLEEYRQILESGFLEEQVGVIPPGLDQVLIGDLERTRLKDIKALFCLGVNEGVVPKSASTGGILTDMDREWLSALSLELAPTVKSRNYTEQFYLYLNLTKPEEYLYLCWSQAGMDGKTLRPSYLIGKMKQLFPEAVVEKGSGLGQEWKKELWRDGGIDYLLKGLEQEPAAGRAKEVKETESERRMLHQYYEEKLREKEKAKESLTGPLKEYYYLMQGFVSEADVNPLQREVAKALYGEIAGSVTRLEEYASCAFAHFLDYGLQLQERQEYTIRMPDLGSIFHDALERFSEKLKAKGMHWAEVDEAMRNQLVHESVAEATSQYGNRILHSSHRLEALIDRVERITNRAVWAISKQVELGEFEPAEFEMKFSFEALRGRIDRMDTAERTIVNADGKKQTEEYLRIIDYKSGGTEFDLGKVYYGLGMQLIVYLRSALEQERSRHSDKLVIPAGVFYFHVQDPIVDKEDGEDALFKALAMNGLVHRDIAVEGMMDQTLLDEAGAPIPSAKSQIIPVAFNRFGEHTAGSQVASEHQMNLLMDHVDRQMREARDSILSGDIAPRPYQLEKRSGCDYCGYRSICGFDRRVNGFSYRTLEPMTKDEVWMKLEQEADADGK